MSCAQQVRNLFEMILISKYCIVYSDKENRQKPAVVVAQLVERDKTGLGKDLNSNPFHQMCVFAGSNPASAAAFQCFPSQKAALLWEISLGKGFHSNQNIHGGIRRFESCPSKAAKEAKIPISRK